MAFFEALVAASISLGLDIPVFLERVMRPQYEERFEEFRMDSRVKFVLAFEKGLEKLRLLKRPGEYPTEGDIAEQHRLKVQNKHPLLFNRDSALSAMVRVSFLRYDGTSLVPQITAHWTRQPSFL
jgi:hypothetical protein